MTTTSAQEPTVLRVSDGRDPARAISAGTAYTVMVGRSGNPSRAALGLDDPELPAVAFSVTGQEDGWTLQVPARNPYEVLVSPLQPEGDPVRVMVEDQFKAPRAEVTVWTPSVEHTVLVEWFPSAVPGADRHIDRHAERLARATKYSRGLLDVGVTDDRALILCCHLRVDRIGAPPATDRQVLALIGQPGEERNVQRLKARVRRALPIVCDRRHGVEPEQFLSTHGRHFTRADAVEYLVRAGLVDRAVVDRAIAVERELLAVNGPW